ncbi:hypothetical protein A5645_10880 [Mycobacterium asiaticum]|nr:hypothetical protein A5645_10880 [Mycobacterium asiaticum]
MWIGWLEFDVLLGGGGTGSGGGGSGGDGAGEGDGAGGGGGTDWLEVRLLRPSSIAAVLRDNCHPDWSGTNSIGNVNSRRSGLAVVTTTADVTCDGFAPDQAMLLAANAIGK